MSLYNKLSKPELLARINAEGFKRQTVSFYRYVDIKDPGTFRDSLYMAFDSLACYGRVYIANEGINAQMSVPEHNMEAFLAYLQEQELMKDMPIKYALEDKSHSFLKLIVRLRLKIVADGLNERLFDVSNVGKHLSPVEFHELSQKKDVVVVDMRNNYESEVGHFINAICPDSETFREEVETAVKLLSDKKDKKILLYCTGGVRCEKASAWMKHYGFKDVNQLHGGIIAYASEIKQAGLQSRFIGKNFVFDERLGERVTPHVLSKCHQCGKPCDEHVNCNYNPCHDLVIQCDECREKHEGCCSEECYHNLKNQASELKRIPG